MKKINNTDFDGLSMSVLWKSAYYPDQPFITNGGGKGHRTPEKKMVLATGTGRKAQSVDEHDETKA